MAEFNFYLIDGTTSTLIDDPVGWDSTMLSLARDSKYIGLFTSYSTELEFIGQAANIIKQKYDQDGIEAKLELAVEYNCNGVFKELYRGRLNFTGYNRKIGDYCSVKLNVEDVSPSVTIRNRAQVEVDLQSLTSIGGESMAVVPGLINPMTLTSRVIRRAARANQPAVGGNSYTSVAAAPTAIVMITKPQYSEFGKTNSFNVGLPASDLSNANFINNDVSLTYTVRCRLKGRIINSGGTTFNFFPWVYKRKTGEAYDVPLSNTIAFFKNTTDPLGSPPFTASVASGNTLEFDLDLTNLAIFSITSDQGVGVVTVDLISNGGIIEIDPESYLNMYADTITGTSPCATAMIHEAGSALFARVTDRYNTFRSHLFGRVNSSPVTYPANGEECFYAITNGYQIRQFPLLERPIYLTVDRFFNSLDAMFCVGMGLEKNGSDFVVRMEKKEYFFEPEPWITFDDIYEINETVASELIYSRVNIGFQKFGAEENETKYGTLDAFATEHQYATRSDQTDNSLDAKSFFIADHYALEYSRRQPYIEDATAEYRYDEDNFIIATSRSTSGGVPDELDLPEHASNFTQVNEIISPATAYNLRLSPKRNLLRWAYWIMVSVYKSATGTFNFKEGKKNVVMTTEFTSDTTDAAFDNALLAEDQDLAYSNVDIDNKGPLFEPTYVEFEYPLSYETWLQLFELNPTSGKPNAYHTIRYGRDNSSLQNGYLWSVDFNPNEGLATFKLLKA